jgi:hypothetical protein
MESSGMTLLDRIVSIVSHRDRDLYALLVLSALLLGVELFAGNWTTSLFAATLGAFALSMIRMRHDVGTLSKQHSGLGSIFLDRTPSDVISSMRSANELLLIGVSLDRTLRNAYTPLESFLARTGQLRVLVVDPRSEWAVRIADRRAYQEHGIEQRRAHIEQSIKSFRELRDRTGGHVDIRVTDDPLTFGATMIDGVSPTRETQIVIQHYSYKKRNATEPNPVFVIRRSDGEWFDEYREELENLWRDGASWPE